MKEIGTGKHMFKLPDSTVATVDRSGADTISGLKVSGDYYELNDARYLLRDELTRRTRDENNININANIQFNRHVLSEYIEEVISAIYDNEIISVGAWSASKLSGLALGQKVTNYEKDNTVVITDLIIKDTIASRGARAKALMRSVADEAKASEIVVVCQDKSSVFYEELFQQEPLEFVDQDGVATYIFIGQKDKIFE